MSFSIEPAQPADIPRLVDMLNNLFGIELDFIADASRQQRGLELLIAEAAQSDHLLAWAKARGATRAQLLADLENTAAERFYDDLGWGLTRLGARRRFIE